MDYESIQVALMRYAHKGWDVAQHGPLAGAWVGDQIDHAARLADLIDLIDAGLAPYDPTATADLIGYADADAPNALIVHNDDVVAAFDLEVTRRRLSIGGQKVYLRKADAGAVVLALVVSLVAQTLSPSPRSKRHLLEAGA